MSPDTLTIIATVIAVGLALAGLIMRSIARTDRRIERAEDAMASFRAESQRWREEFRAEMQRAHDAFRAEMQRLAERQSHVEGRMDRPPAGAD